ncbi:BppU family phage baseplate upper protein [Pediococcus pentosaceus]|uniref:BppU family phage baseplate upper protein n=1 Tax=Pediococcus pentosaceus TaxID=1255 RepID=UPI00211A9BCA|nr:BppU family phage baseplate upper protein [Pediococcus pentosaceus]MCQ9196822.1 BppU family phage baseplate upper protein [Pediococcus pentosaceus]
MSMYLTFTIGKDKRNLVDDITDFHIDNSTSTNPQWLQARQNEDGMRQVFVTVKNEDGSPFNLTDCNYWFQGKLPDGVHKIIDARHGVTLDAQNGKFRFDMPKHAFTVAGSYVQAFFRIVRNGESLTTLEFDLTVLADLVYNDLVPSDYITPFEDLYGKLKEYLAKFNGDFETAMAQWKKDVVNLISDLNADISGINLTITEIKAQLSALEDKIKADNLLTQADLDAALIDIKKQIKDGLAELSKQIAVGDNIEIGKDVTAENENAIVNIISQLDPNNFNIGYITDNHGGLCSWTTDYSDKYAYDHLNNFLKLDGNVDVMIAGGDNSDCYRPSDPAIVVDNRRFDTQFLFGTDNLSDKFILKGNHDDGSIRTNDYRRGTRTFESVPHVLRDSEFNKMIAADQLLFDEKRNNGKSYFYKDYPNKKVRVIGLNSNDTPDDILLDDGEPKYLGIWRMGYRQEQLNWLANVALQNVPEDYVTIIFSHIQANIPSYENDGNNDHDSHYNQDILIQIIKDFMAGSSSSLTGDIKDYEINLKTNFVTQGKRNFAGYIHGHEHVEEVSTDLGFNNIGFFASYNVKGVFTGDTDAWQTISIDRTNRKLIIKGFGRATNRVFSY